MNWVKSNQNFILQGEGFSISFLDWESSKKLGATTWENDERQDETCLISPDRDYFILNGDFRKEYEELLPLGYIKCYQFFLNNQDKKSSWSN